MLKAMKPLLFFLAMLFSGLATAQDKVRWEVSYNSAQHQLEFRADIAEGWHLYSQHIRNDIGPVPTTFVFTDAASVKFDGGVSEPEPIREYDQNFEASLDFFKHEALFTRKVAPGSKGTISGYITYMVCNDMQCLPPVDQEFTVKLP
jgi:hypothetical protein